ncbi:MAG: SDR family oxidoreductase [Runella slithyformis]|nr:MAG: SDR family oxidoreductase [Runella slithyformis]TAF97451.1 MAG: SDR family oxidoreductase [Runella sp.]TAG22232.1 MAG: SDR family oxidoreductase [Cytophagales bacterium]TAG41321.1 MAG: SDR family oxidoreductase [Cytophagia bacterium]TAF48255.1 MAG: SDR family oxidoreductase [Runella slithyformis]
MKTTLLTGASKGIGKVLAVALAKAGHNLGLVARSEKELNDVKTEVEAAGGKCLIFVGNVSDEALANEAVSQLVATFGSIDFMINNAGYGIFGPTESYTAEVWSELYDTNVKGTFLFSKAVLPTMKAAGRGHIINIASDVAKRVFDGGALYCSSKFAQDAFSAALRKEVRKDGIKVSVVYSGLVDTMFHTDPQGHDSHTDWLKPEDMTDSIMYIMNQPAHVVIDELMIHPLSQDY